MPDAWPPHMVVIRPCPYPWGCCFGTDEVLHPSACDALPYGVRCEYSLAKPLLEVGELDDGIHAATVAGGRVEFAFVGPASGFAHA